MSLTDEVQARVPTKRLAQLTQPPGSALSTVNTAVLVQACTDVEADFELFGQVTFDVTKATHVAVAVRGVLTKLQLYKGTQGAGWAETQQKLWKDELQVLRSRAGIPTTSSAVRTPEADDADLAPKLGPSFWAGYVSKGGE